MTWLSILHTIDKSQYADLLEYCQRAASQDKTFIFEVQADRIIIQSPDRDQAYRRGQLLHFKFNVFYEVVKK
jgi:hypothetical protein